jgi:hypothetical protein
MLRSLSRRCGLAAVVATVSAGALASGAGATTVYPAGGQIDLGAETGVAAFPTAPAGTVYCDVDRGTVAVPAAPGNANPSGPVTLEFSTLPSFTNCIWRLPGGATNPASVTTSGRWTLTLDWGLPTTTAVTIPARGISVATYCAATTASYTANGFWQNGISSPVFVDSVLSPGSMSGVPFGVSTRCREVNWATTSSFAATNATDPTAIAGVVP